jgi:hypothetical protein
VNSYTKGGAPAHRRYFACIAGINLLDRMCVAWEITARLMISKRSMQVHDPAIDVIELHLIVVVLLRIIPGVA